MTKQDYVSIAGLELRYPYIYPSDIDGKAVTIELEVVSKYENADDEWRVRKFILEPTHDENLAMVTQQFGTNFRKTGHIIWKNVSKDYPVKMYYYAVRNIINDTIAIALQRKDLSFIRVTIQPKRGKKVVRLYSVGSKPSKMESKKMYHKKYSTQKSPVKRMTGDIGALGKNFNKLI